MFGQPFAFTESEERCGYADHMRAKETAALQAFVDLCYKRGDYNVVCETFFARINDTPCLYGTAISTFRFQSDGAVRIAYFELQYEKEWKHGAGSGQVI